MKIKLKSLEELEEIVKPIIISDTHENNYKAIFGLVHKEGIPGSIVPMMIKYLGAEIEVEEDINPNTYIFKEWIEGGESYYEIKFRTWMLK